MRGIRQGTVLAASQWRQLLECSRLSQAIEAHRATAWPVATALASVGASGQPDASSHWSSPENHGADARCAADSGSLLLSSFQNMASSRATQCRMFSTAASAAQGHDDGPIYRSGPLSLYQRQIAEGILAPGDIHQEAALAALQALYDVLIGAAVDGHLVARRKEHGTSLWSRWLPMVQPAAVRGLYLWGGVGTGKTMLMDMMYHELPSWLLKGRIHFHDFMLSVHSKLRKHRGLTDPLAAVAEEISREAMVLCVDEFMVTDVADAMLLNRLFNHVFSKGVVLVSTSNRPPDRLYENGLQRDLFLPFIALLKERCVVHEIGSSTDYRRLTKVQKGLCFTGPDASSLLEDKVQLLADGIPMEPTSVEVVMGRRVHVPHAANGVASFQFHELCEMPLGAADFFGLVRHFHTIAVDGIPCFGASNRAAAYRFVTLVDVMYEHKARLVCSAEDEPMRLFERVVTMANAPKKTASRSRKADDADLAVDNELGFAKERTMSRLMEMQSEEYQHHHASVYKKDAASTVEESHQVAQAS